MRLVDTVYEYKLTKLAVFEKLRGVYVMCIHKKSIQKKKTYSIMNKYRKRA